MDLTREELFFAAQLSDNAERYEDMVASVRKLVQNYPDLSERERELLASAFKYLITQYRNSWRIAAAIQQREQARTRKIQHRLDYCLEQLENIEKKYLSVCGEVQSLIDDSLLPKASDTGARVFLLKMKGDYYRYLCEIYQQNQAKLNETAEHALYSYGQASDEAIQLSEADTVRLGLALNFSVFYYEIEQNIEMACDVAHTAYESGSKKVSQGSAEEHKEASQILALIHDNLLLWRQDQADDDQEQNSQEDQ